MSVTDCWFPYQQALRESGTVPARLLYVVGRWCCHFTLPDDYIESVTLMHRIPEDAAIEFPLSKQGTPTVTISGGCTPISEQQELDGKKAGIEVGRSCSFTWGSVTLLKELQVRF